MTLYLCILFVANFALATWTMRCAIVNERVARRNIKVADANYGSHE